MHAEIAKLLDLQSKDLTLLEADLRLKSILDEESALDITLDGARRERQVAEKRLEDGVKKRTDLEVRIDGYRAIQETRRQRLEVVKGAREAQAVMTEVEMARAVLVREEGDWVKVAEGVHDLERGLKTAQDRLAEVEASQADERARLAEERARLEGERAGALSAREESAGQLERAVRTRYDRLRGAREAAVVVALLGDVCGSCHTAVPRHRRAQIRAGDLLDSCEGCGVILYAEEQVD